MSTNDLQAIQVTRRNISMYPRHREYVEQVIRERNLPGTREFSRALQIIIDEHKAMTDGHIAKPVGGQS